MNGQDVVNLRTVRRLRSLLRDLADSEWESLFFSEEQRKSQATYEVAIAAEITAHGTAYGLATEEEVFMPGLTREAEREITRFVGWGANRGHHAARIQLGAFRIRAPFIFLMHAGDWESPRNLDADDVLAIVRCGIKREKRLLRRSRNPFIVSGPGRQP